MTSWQTWSIAMVLFGGGIGLYALGKDAGAMAAIGAAGTFLGVHAHRQSTARARVEKELGETTTTLQRIKKETGQP